MKNQSKFWATVANDQKFTASNTLVVVSSVQPTHEASELLRVCLKSLISQKNVDLSILVVDVGSKESDFRVRPSEFPTINFAYAVAAPQPWLASHYPPLSKNGRLAEKLKMRKANIGIFLNGWGLDFGILLSTSRVRGQPDFILTLQMDTMFCHETAIEEMLMKMEPGVAAVGLRVQKSYDNKHEVLHSLGCLWRTEILQETNVPLLPNFPQFDVGEEAIVRARSLGYKLVGFQCSYSDPLVASRLKSDEIRGLNTDRTIGDDGRLMFMHLGRGIPKAKGVSGQRGTIDQWISIWSEIENGSITL